MANAHVQGTGLTSVQTTTTPTIAFPSNVTSGHLLVCNWRIGSTSATVSSISDSLSNTWTTVYDIADGGGSLGGWAYTFSGSSGANTITLHLAASPGTVLIACAEYSGPNAVRGTSASESGNGTTATSNTVSTSSGDLLLGFLEVATGSTFTAGSGYSIYQQSTSGGTPYVAIEENLNGSGGASTTASFSLSSSFYTVGLGAFYNNIPSATSYVFFMD